MTQLFIEFKGLLGQMFPTQVSTQLTQLCG